jgi:hypothetical protein
MLEMNTGPLRRRLSLGRALPNMGGVCGQVLLTNSYLIAILIRLTVMVTKGVPSKRKIDSYAFTMRLSETKLFS